jgi:protease I
MAKIARARVLIISDRGFEQAELEVPRDKLREAGAEVEIATPDGKDIRGWDRTDWGRTAKADKAIADAKADDYDALVIPGGQINPDLLRIHAPAMGLVEAFLKSGKIVAAICHGPWLLAEADAVKDRTITSYKSIRTDMIHAGAKWVNRPVVRDGGVITSRSPDDLPVFVGAIVEALRDGSNPTRSLAA